MEVGTTWNLPFAKIEKLFGPLPRVAIETGTCRGNATRALARRFSRVVTIELSSELHRDTEARLRSEPGHEHVEFLQGDSTSQLPRALAQMGDATKPVFIFLDAHWSGDRSVDWDNSRWKGYGIDTAHLGESGARQPSGPEQCPLAGELRAIVQHCRGPAWILIDDLKNLPPSGDGVRDLEFSGEDWSHLSRELLLSIVAPRLLEAHVLTEPAQWVLRLDRRPNGRGAS